MQESFPPGTSQDISSIYTILVCTKEKKMNQTYKIMRQYFSQYPVLKSVKYYQCLVNFIFVFALLILHLCLLGKICYMDSQILYHFLYIINF